MNRKNIYGQVQSIGVLNISLEHFERILERFSHGSYVHLPLGLSLSIFLRFLEKQSQKRTYTHHHQPIAPLQHGKTLIHRPKTPHFLLVSLSLRSGFGPSAVILSVLESEAEKKRSAVGVGASRSATCREKGVT